MSNFTQINTQSIAHTRQLRDLKELCSMKAGEAFTWLYGFSHKTTFVEENGKINEFINARDWWERTSAITQCNNTVGKYDSKTICYICGNTVGQDTRDSPECEHILPVFQGALLLKLYRDDYKKIMNSKKTSNNDVRNELLLEYDWAHRCCNQIKSNKSFLTFDTKTNKFVLDFPSTKNILRKIYSGKNDDKQDVGYCQIISKIIKNSNTKPENWITERADIINVEKIRPICEYLNKSLNGEERKGLFYLSILSNLISAADSIYVDSASRAAKGQSQLRPPPEGESITKVKVYNEINILIEEVFNKNIKWGRNRKEINELMVNIFSPFTELKEKKYLLNSSGKPEILLIREALYDGLITGNISGKKTGLIDLNTTFTFSSVFRDIYSILIFNLKSGEQALISDKKQGSEMAESCLKIIALILLLNNFENIKKTPLYQSLKNETDSLHFGVISKLNNELSNLSEMTKDVIDGNVLFSILTNVMKEISNDANALLLKYLLELDVKIQDVEKYVRFDNVLHARTEYYKLYMTEMKTITEEEMFNNIDLLEVSAVDKLETILLDIKELKDEKMDDLIVALEPYYKNYIKGYQAQIKEEIKDFPESVENTEKRQILEESEKVYNAVEKLTAESLLKLKFSEEEIDYEKDAINILTNLKNDKGSPKPADEMNYLSRANRILNFMNRPKRPLSMEQSNKRMRVQGGRKTRKNSNKKNRKTSKKRM
jgi:hypothetical protein